MSIRIKLILIITVVLVVVGSVMGTIIYRQNTQKLTEHINVDIKNTINFTSQLVSFYLDRVENNLVALANDPIIVTALETKKPELLAQASEKMTVISETVDIIENIGLHEIIGSSCFLVAGDHDTASFVGMDFSKRDYCQGVIKTRKSYFSSSFVGVVSNKPVLGLVVPVKNTRGEMIGYVLGNIDLTQLRGYLWDMQDDSKVELLDRYNALFLSTETTIENLNEIRNTEEAEIIEIKKRLANDKKEGYFTAEEDFLGYKNNGYITIIFEKSAESLLALAQTLNLTILFSLAFAIFLIILIIVFFVGRITKRISRLSQISQDIAGGKFEIKLEEADLMAKDETAILARAFNDMATKLSGVYKDLEDKVKQRTTELEENNKKLASSEVELKQALDLSERTNKVMVGRELEMIKLKEEMATLKNKQ